MSKEVSPISTPIRPLYLLTQTLGQIRIHYILKR